MDGCHGIERCEAVTSEVLEIVFAELAAHRVLLEGMLLKPNMVIAGMKCMRLAGVQQVAEATIRCLRRYVPAAVPGIVFLSGGQSAERCHRPSERHERDRPASVATQFFLRAGASGTVLAAWKGQESNAAAAQRAFFKRCRLNGLARDGMYARAMEAAT